MIYYHSKPKTMSTRRKGFTKYNTLQIERTVINEPKITCKN